MHISQNFLKKENYIHNFLYLENIAENINDKNTDGDGYAGPCDHNWSPFWRRNLRAINCSWYRGHACRDSRNDSAYKNLFVCSS